MSKLELNLKSFLKTLKLNESNLSMFLGALVIVVVGVLVVNYFRDRGKGITLPGLTATQEQPTAETSKKYTVVTGDNLWKIAEKYYGSGYNWVDVAKANNLKNPSVITVGQVLTMPEATVKTPTTKVATGTGLTPITGASYTVVRGDNLWKIAIRAYGDGYQWTKIAKENRLVHPNLIHSGNLLTIPR